MKQYVEINGVNFELSDEINFRCHVNSRNYHFPALYNCYEKPSYRKVSIYEEWFKWFEATKQNEEWQYKATFGVRSYNTNVFTLGITLVYEQVWYYLEIFPTRNVAHKLIVC